MKRKMPLDIEFLLESLTGTPINAHQKINEDPDNVVGDEGEEGINYNDGDNIAFFCTSEYSLIGPGNIHHELMRGIRHNRRNNIRNLDFFDDVGIVVANEKEMFHDIFDKNGRLFKYLAKLDKNDAEAGNYRSEIEGFLAGRLWVNKRVISFWNSQEDVIANWDAVENMFLEHGNRIGSLRAYKVDWVERYDSGTPMTPADSISSSKKKKNLSKSVDYENEPVVDDKGQMNFFAKLFRNPILLDKLSDTQLKQIRDKVHVMDPQLKAQIMKANHSAIVNKAGEIADKLGMSVAEFHSLWSMDENNLNENPDGVMGGSVDDTGKPDKLGWRKGETFFAGKTFSIVGPSDWGSTHYDITGYAKQVFNSGEFNMSPFSDIAVDISDENALLKDILVDGGAFNEYFNNNPEYADEGLTYRTEIKNVLLGRLWIKQKIISFWSEQKTVVQLWPNVKKLFDDNPRLGKLGGYKIDWVEREEHTDPFTQASTLEQPSSDKSNVGDQMNFFTKIFNSPNLLSKLSPEQLKKVRDKVHVMEPEMKAQIMKANHETLINKADEIATKLGMSVAEFHSLWSMDENKLNEDPDSLKLNPIQVQILKKKGIDASVLKRIYYDSNDAVSFLINVNKKLTVYNVQNEEVAPLTHPDVGATIMGYLAAPNDYKKFEPLGTPGIAFELSDEIDVPPGTDVGAVAVLQSKSLPEFVRDIKRFSDDLPLDGDVPRKSLKFIQGRIWLDHNVVSFWSTKEFCMSHFDLINQFLVGMHKKKEDVAYEFIDSNHYYSYDELANGAVLTRSKEEMDRLMAIQHLDPEAKKKLAMMQGNLKQKGDAGWDFQAQKHAAMPALQESPDRVEVPEDNRKELEDAGLDPRRMNGSHWKDSDAITFVLDVTDKRGLWIAADQVVIGNEQYAHRPNHAAMMRQIAYFRQYPNEFEIKTFGSQPVLVSKPDANRLKVWIVKGGVHGVDFSGTEDFSAYLAMAEWTKKVERKTLPGNLILGRYWRNSGVMSFWQKKSWVLEHFKLVEDLLKEFSVVPNKVAYEFIDIRKVFPYNELFGEHDDKLKRGSEEIKDLIKKQHTDPSAKKKLKDMGYYDTAKDKKELGGFDYVAKKNAAMPALQEIVRQINNSK